MPRRRCQYCTRPLGRWARWLLTWTCRGCVNRLSMGGSPMRPPVLDEEDATSAAATPGEETRTDGR